MTLARLCVSVSLKHGSVKRRGLGKANRHSDHYFQMSLSYSILKKQNDSWSIHLSTEHADAASRGKVLRWLGLALLALAAVIHLLSHQEALPLAILWFPSCHSYQSFLKHSKSIAEFLPPPIPISLLHLFSPDDKAHLDMTMACALQIRNQRKSYLQ